METTEIIFLLGVHYVGLYALAWLFVRVGTRHERKQRAAAYRASDRYFRSH